MRFLSLLAAVALATARSPPVKVSVQSSWAAPPLLLEIIETVGLEKPSVYFDFLDRVTDPTRLLTSNPLTPEAVYQYSLGVATQDGLLSEPGALTAVEMNLALHAATPKIEAFYNYYSNYVKDLDPNCGSWVDWYGTIVCDVETLVKLAGTLTLGGPSSNEEIVQPHILPFDHIYPSAGRPRTAVLYASLTSPNFRELHSYLLSLAKEEDSHVAYVLRHIPQHSTSRVHLSGYSVALDLKKTDYLVLDDRGVHSKEVDDTPESETENTSHVDVVLALLDNHPENDTTTPLSEEELLEIGFKATQLISESEEPLKTLKHLSQDFPRYATSLSRRVTVSEPVLSEIHTNHLKTQSGSNGLWINGVFIANKDVNALSLLRLLKKEKGMVLSLTELGLSRGEAIQLLTHPELAVVDGVGSAFDGIYDASDRVEGGEVVVYWNDIERDSRYAQWSPSVMQLLRPMYPGQFPSVKLNMFNIVLLLDLSQATSINFIASPVSNIIERNFAFRFGVVPIVETEDGLKMARLFYYIVDTLGRKAAMSFFKSISEPRKADPTVNWKLVKETFEQLTKEDTSLPSLNAIISGEVVTRADTPRIKAYVDRLGGSLEQSALGHGFVNGKYFEMGEQFLHNMQFEIQQQTKMFQDLIYAGVISDEALEGIDTYFYDLPASSKRRNKYIIPGAGAPNVHNVAALPISKSFLYSSEDPAPLTVWVIADFATEAGVRLLKEALIYAAKAPVARLGFVHSSSEVRIDWRGKRDRIHWVLSHLVGRDTLSALSPETLLDFVLEATAHSEFGTQQELTDGLALHELDPNHFVDFANSGRDTVEALKLTPGKSALLVNGRVVGPFGDDDFLAADFEALEAYELRKRVLPLAEALGEIMPTWKELDRESHSDLILRASSLLASLQQADASETGVFDNAPRARQTNFYDSLDGTHTAFSFGNNITSLYHVGVVVDPLSEIAQKWSSIIEWLANVPDTYIEVHLNPTKSKEIPLKRFFRSNLAPALSFDENGVEIPAVAVFEDLPVDPLYTLALDLPGSWLTRPKESVYDLDNIQLGKLSPGDDAVEALFELDYIVIEGHARDTLTNGPPRGVQLELTNADESSLDDTLVVANLGYFQFKAKPGVFELGIREGRSKEVFELQSVGNEGWESRAVEEIGREVTVTSFEGLTLYPRLQRRPGMEQVDVLSDEKLSSKDNGVVEEVSSWVKSLFGSAETTDVVVKEDHADINIFTVASGLLYERFVGIMILSVMRNTKSTVKFWFIENFLSPSFLEFIPHLAEAYNFKYELVTYKWPSWLRAQKEKQRIIWAYKILFLDVLFPMDLKKVIFVDADQIVRADLQELVDTDLQGAPYGYTPMGDDNYDMEGFRFWKTGYWKDFLKGRPYHISALYVVDLVRFRQIAAGDILRQQYQSLSGDPNSLANLDQDLPNNLQKDVPIFSLHEDWLWCETWCSKDRLERAKTIDLCQNPLTKEPKLARARQIPEWEAYDNEIATFAKGLKEKGLLKSEIAAQDTNALANDGAAAPPEVKEKATATRDEL